MARILVVDDQAVNRDLLTYLLTYFGHEVSTACDGAQAVRAAAADPPDLVIIDIAMPGMDGYTAAGLMRSEQALRDVPLIAISATTTPSLDMARAAGFDSFYPQPIYPDEFMAKLEVFIGGPPDAERDRRGAGATRARGRRQAARAPAGRDRGE
jgi:two-component system cell cycle response regulator